MIPRSLSASAVKNFETCAARWNAESNLKTPGGGGAAAFLGSAVHEALDTWVKTERSHDDDATVGELLALFDTQYFVLFGSDHTRLAEGREMLTNWYNQTHPLTNEVLSTELKETFDLKTSIGPIPFTYIWDRCDRLPNGDVEVIDYKTISMPISADGLRNNIQARSYALAAAIKYPDAKRIWVSFDMLRFGEPVGVSFDREDNKLTWQYLHDVAERVIAENEDAPTENVNDECRWCIRKHSCKTLEAHAMGGGLHAMYNHPTDGLELEQIVDKRAILKYVQGALGAMVGELDEAIMKAAERDDFMEYATTKTTLAIKAVRRRNVEGMEVKRIVPAEVWDKYGSEDITMGQFDKLIKDERLTTEQRAELKSGVTNKFSAPYIQTSEKKQEVGE